MPNLLNHLFKTQAKYLEGIPSIKTPVNTLWRQVYSENNLQQAFEWLCRQSKESSHNSDVWGYRYEQGASKRRIGQYLVRWLCWATLLPTLCNAGVTASALTVDDVSKSTFLQFDSVSEIDWSLVDSLWRGIPSVSTNKNNALNAPSTNVPIIIYHNL